MSQTLAPRIVDLHDICLARLRDCRDPQTDLLSRQIRDGAWAPTLGTERITSTAISLVGLHRAGIAPRAVSRNSRSISARVAGSSPNSSTSLPRS